METIRRHVYFKKSKFFKKILPIVAIVAVFFAQTLWAQEFRRRGIWKKEKTPAPDAATGVERTAPGRIVGTAVDATTGETLAGAIVRIGDKGTVADYEGKFEFEAVPAGTYALSFEMVSYKPLTLSNVTVKAQKTTEVRAAMSEDLKTLETVVVEDEMRKSSDVALVAIQKNAVQISDGYSGDMVLKQTPGFQFNTVLRRMPGVALVEDRYLSIRGLFERYNTFTLNGAPVPINDFERNGFDYSYLPSNVISSLRIIKTASSDIVNEFGGGCVQLETADIPQANQINVSVMGEYHPLTTFRTLQSMPTNHRPFLLRELRGLPDNFPSPAALGGGVGASTPENRAAILQLSEGKLLSSAWETSTAAPGVNVGATVQRRFPVGGQSAGITAYAGYFQTQNITPLVQQTASTAREIGVRPVLIDSFGSELHHRETLLTGMLNFGMRLGRGGKITFKNMLVHQAKNHRMPQEGISGDYGYYYQIGRVQGSTLYSGQALLEKTLFDLAGGSALLSFKPFYSLLENREPALSGYNYDFDSTWQNAYFNPDTSEYIAVWTARQKHRLGGGQLSLEIPLGTKEVKAVAGALVYHNVHDYRSRFIGYSFAANDTGELIYPEAEKLRYRENVDYFSPLIANGELVVYDRTPLWANYRSQRTLWAPFLQLNYRPIRKLTLNAGLRIETYKQHIRAVPEDTAAFDVVRGTLTDLLPSFNGAYSLNPKTNLRWAYAQTVVRTRDRELVPFAYLDYVSTIKTLGNPRLVRTKIHNIDLRYEYYPRKADLISMTWFYKYFLNPVEQVLNEGIIIGINDAQIIYEVRNQKSAAVAGVELEFRQSLEPYVKNLWLSGLGVYGNVSLMASRINPVGAFDLFGAGRGLQGQANFLLNFGLTYSEEKTGLSAAVFYNRVGRRIAWVGVSDNLYPSIFEMPRDLLDVQISKTFFEKLTLRLAVQDLLAQRFKLIQFYDDGKTFEENRDLLVRNERRAPLFYLTVGYKF